MYFTQMTKKLFFFLLGKWLTASGAAKHLGIDVRATQRWIKHYYEDSESIFEKKEEKSGRYHILGEEYEQFISSYVYEDPFAVLAKIAKNLL